MKCNIHSLLKQLLQWNQTVPVKLKMAADMAPIQSWVLIQILKFFKVQLMYLLKWMTEKSWEEWEFQKLIREMYHGTRDGNTVRVRKFFVDFFLYIHSYIFSFLLLNSYLNVINTNCMQKPLERSGRELELQCRTPRWCHVRAIEITASISLRISQLDGSSSNFLNKEILLKGILPVKNSFFLKFAFLFKS